MDELVLVEVRDWDVYNWEKRWLVCLHNNIAICIDEYGKENTWLKTGVAIPTRAWRHWREIPENKYVPMENNDFPKGTYYFRDNAHKHTWLSFVGIEKDIIVLAGCTYTFQELFENDNYEWSTEDGPWQKFRKESN